MKNIHILPTDKPSRLYLGNNGNFVFGMIQTLIQSRNDDFTNQNIYITNDEIVTENSTGLYFIDVYTDTRHIFSPIYINKDTIAAGKFHTYMNNGDMCKKIIMTTDPILILNGVQAIDDDFLEWFVKNPSCEEVVVIKKSRCCGRCNGVDDLCYTDMCCDDHHVYGCETCYGKRVEYLITILKEEPKKVLTEEDIFNQRDIDAINTYIKIDQLVDEEAKKIKEQHYQYLIDMMQDDEEAGLYDDIKTNSIELVCKDCSDSLEDCTCIASIIDLPNQALIDVAERLKGKELFKESNDRARKILSEIKSLPMQERMYSEEDMAESFMACWKANVPEGFECKLSFKEWINEFKKNQSN